MNTQKNKVNLWSFIHIHILYLFQRTAIMVWLNTLEGLQSKFIKTFKFNFEFIQLYKISTVYFIIFCVILFML